jgi:hypothetical protein
LAEKEARKIIPFIITSKKNKNKNKKLDVNLTKVLRTSMMKTMQH